MKVRFWVRTFLPGGSPLKTRPESWVCLGSGSPPRSYTRATCTGFPSLSPPASPGNRQKRRFCDGKIPQSATALSAQHLQVAPQLRGLVLVHGQPHQRHLHGGALQQPRVGFELPRLRVEARRHRFKHQVYLQRVAWKDHSWRAGAQRRVRHSVTSGQRDSSRGVVSART